MTGTAQGKGTEAQLTGVSTGPSSPHCGRARRL